MALSLYTDCYQLCSLLYRTCLKALLRVVQNPAFNSDRSQKHKNRFSISLESFLSARLRLQLRFRLLSRGQCDQMARLFIPNLAIYINENWLNGIKITKEGPTFCQIQNKSNGFYNLAQNDEISPNLVTVLEAHLALNGDTKIHLETMSIQCDHICHLGKILQAFGNFLTVYFLFGKMLGLLWQICYTIGLNFIVVNGQILKNNLTIWLHWMSKTNFSFILIISL